MSLDANETRRKSRAGCGSGVSELRRREGEFEARELRVEQAAKLSARPEVAWAKVGRNEPCPCGSGLKYKHCHGRPSRIRASSPGGTTIV